MTITTTRFNNEDYSYFLDNFEVIDSNVSSLDDANAILLGETHHRYIDCIKNCWLLNKITSDNDYIYLEGLHEGIITNETFEKLHHNPIYNEVKFKTWDCQKTYKKNFLKIPKFCEIIKDLKNILKLLDLNITDEEKICMIQKMNTFYSANEIREEINQLLLSQFDIYPKSIQIPQLLNKMNKIVFLAKNSSGEELNALFHLAASSVTTLLNLFSELALTGTDYLKRTASLCENIQQEEGKYYGIHGRFHLKSPDMIAEKMNEKLMETLKDKKFIILFPNGNNENLEHLKQFFSSNSKKTKKYATIFFVTLAIAMFIYHICLVIAEASGRIFLNSKIIDVPSDINIYQLGRDLNTLDKQFKEKLNSIPDKDIFNIQDKYLIIAEEFLKLKELEPAKPKKKIKILDSSI